MKAIFAWLADFYRRRLRRFYIVRAPKFVVWWLFWFVRWKLIYGVRGVLWPRVKWFVRWHVIYPVTGSFLPRVLWLLRWHVVHPLTGSVIPRIAWFLRWHVWHPITGSLIPRVAGFIRWHVWYPMTGSLIPRLVWFVRWHIVHPVTDNLNPRVAGFVRWHVWHPLVGNSSSRVVWFLRWHVIYPIKGRLSPRVAWFVRRRVVQPIKSSVPKALWFLRWRVARPLARAFLPGAVLRGYHRLRGMGLSGVWMQPRVPLLPLVSQSQARKDAQAAPVLIFPAAMVTCAQPAVYPKALAKAVPALQKAYPFPPVLRTTFQNAEVVGRSNMVITDGAVIHHDLYRFSHDFTSEELHGKIRIYPGRPAVKRYSRPQVKRSFERAAAFTDSCAPNYAHWLTEVLPRIHAYAQSGPAPGSTVLIDAGLHANLRASAELMLGDEVKLEELEQGNAAYIEQIDVVSPGGYIPFDRRPGAVRGHSHGVFSGPTLRSMRQHLAGRLGPSARPTPAKVLLRRKSTGRVMKNEQELEDRLALVGFESVYPERLTFAEQYHLFSSAEVIVGATGAAMASLIFCPPETHVIICLSAHPKHSYGYWQGMAGAVGNSVTYVLGPLDGPRSAGIHADFSIDVEHVIEAIRSRPRATPATAHHEALPEPN